MFNNSIALVIISVLFSVCTKAQSYKASVETRVGIKTLGIATRVFINPVAAVDGIFSVGYDNKRVLFTALYEEHYAVKDVTDRFKLFCGAGMHIGFTRNDEVKNDENLNIRTKFSQVSRPDKLFIIGADAIVGMDYKLNKVPINIGIDIKPNVDFMNGRTILLDGGVRVGFTF